MILWWRSGRSSDCTISGSWAQDFAGGHSARNDFGLLFVRDTQCLTANLPQIVPFRSGLGARAGGLVGSDRLGKAGGAAKFLLRDAEAFDPRLWAGAIVTVKDWRGTVCASVPGMVQREGARGLARDLKGAQAGVAQIIIKHGDLRIAHHIERTLHRIGGDGCAAGERFEQNKSECVGFAGENEHVAGAIGPHKIICGFFAEEFCVRIFVFEASACWAIADDDLGARQIERKKSLDVLLDRDATDIEPDRTRVGKRWTQHRTELVDVDAARPDTGVLESIRLEFALERWVATIIAVAGA